MSMIPPSRAGATRHACLALPLALALASAGCVATEPERPIPIAKAIPHAAYAAMYGERPEERFALPATDISGVDPRFFRQEVAYPRDDQPGTLVVDPGAKFLYLVRENGRALRYGVGVGRAGLAWSGTARVGRKAEWPRWTPTADMITRDPERNAPWKGGMAGGPGNPLGPRALYLHEGGRDTLYRIHGTTEPGTIGTDVSSGCIRMFNQDVIDLYGRVPVDTNVIVLAPDDRVEPGQAPVARREGPDSDES